MLHPESLQNVPDLHMTAIVDMTSNLPDAGQPHEGLDCGDEWSLQERVYRMLQALKAGATPLRTARQCLSVCPVSRFVPPRNCMPKESECMNGTLQIYTQSLTGTACDRGEPAALYARMTEHEGLPDPGKSNGSGSCQSVCSA